MEGIRYQNPIKWGCSMSNPSNDLSIANSSHADLLNLHSTLSAKLDAAQTENFELQREDEQARAEFTECERRHILDNATDSELEAAQSKADNMRLRLQASTRRMELIRQAITDHTLKINSSLQSMRIIRRVHCITIRNAVFEELQSDKKLKSRILQAMAAQASTGMESYTYDVMQFAQQFLVRILPAISVEDVKEAAEKFKKENDLS